MRPPAVAGSWYPGGAAALAAEIDRHLAAARPPAMPGRLVALVSPHAGLRYSGPVAAWGYSLLRGLTAPTFVLVGPSHRIPFDGVSVWPRGEWQTPLGPLAIDEELAGRLLAADRHLVDDARPHLGEHSLEMQTPFLKHLVPEARIVPLLMGSQAREEVEMLAAALGRALGGRPALLIASSDLSHYHPSAEAAVLDARVVERVRAFDAEGLMDLLERRHDHACGGGPMVAVMKAAAALGAGTARVLRYADSGDVPAGDKSQVVGYVSAAFS
ncbi:MAG TPA: AmmeMemoRadiSam system protein B, partial [Vicinamibacteria bacterium]|nr:AmmeMemoRadiSam system protein B [Vicinamibacteria bacterium]